MKSQSTVFEEIGACSAAVVQRRGPRKMFVVGSFLGCLGPLWRPKAVLVHSNGAEDCTNTLKQLLFGVERELQ